PARPHVRGVRSGGFSGAPTGTAGPVAAGAVSGAFSAGQRTPPAAARPRSARPKKAPPAIFRSAVWELPAPALEALRCRGREPGCEELGSLGYASSAAAASKELVERRGPAESRKEAARLARRKGTSVAPQPAADRMSAPAASG